MNQDAAETSPDLPPPSPRGRAARIVRILIGLILLAAAVLKIAQMATEPTSDCIGLRCRMVPVAEACLEMMLGLWLLGGLLPALSHMAAAVTFLMFLGIAIHQGVTGKASCGCFGNVSVPPWYTAGLDAGCLLALLTTWRGAMAGRPPRRPWLRLALVAAAVAGLCAASVVMIGRYRPGLLADDGTISGDAGHVLLRPQTWPGGKWALLEHIDIGPQLATGDWTVVLYKADCPVCHEKLPELEAGLRSGRLTGHYAVVELPPIAAAADQPFGPNPPFTVGRLDAARRWHVGTPTLVHLRDGRVIDAQ